MFLIKIIAALRGDGESTPLQLKLNDLAELIAKLGSIAGLILFGSLMIRFFVQLGDNEPVRYVEIPLVCPRACAMLTTYVLTPGPQARRESLSWIS